MVAMRFQVNQPCRRQLAYRENSLCIAIKNHNYFHFHLFCCCCWLLLHSSYSKYIDYSHSRNKLANQMFTWCIKSIVRRITDLQMKFRIWSILYWEWDLTPWDGKMNINSNFVCVRTFRALNESTTNIARLNDANIPFQSKHAVCCMTTAFRWQWISSTILIV